MVLDCRSLISFGKSSRWLQNMTKTHATSVHRASNRRKTLNPLSHPFCEHSPFAAIDIIILLLVLVALGVLTLPCFKLILSEIYELIPPALEVVNNVPIAFAAGFFLTIIIAIGACDMIDQRVRRCGKPGCKGLRKAVEFDIQLETEECVKYLPSVMEGLLVLGEDHRELEAELKKMAPPNGRTVLIFRAPCGCPKGRVEVWGQKKVRRIKK